jgi:hypothetical protein
VKPFRGKRRGPQSPPVGFNPPARRPARRRIRKERVASDRRVDGCTFGGRNATTGSSAVRSPPGRWPIPQGFGVIDRGGVGPSADRGRPLRGRRPLLGSGRPFDLRGLSSVPADRGRSAIGTPGVGSGSVANRSVTCPTRLETRTKESNMCASHWVLRNLEAQ